MRYKRGRIHFPPFFKTSLCSLCSLPLSYLLAFGGIRRGIGGEVFLFVISRKSASRIGERMMRDLWSPESSGR
jgi:hypothetical protein